MTILAKHAVRALVVGAVALLLAGPASPAARADTLSDFEDDVEEWIDATRDAYGLDEQERNLVWEAYCQELDPGYDEDDHRDAVTVAAGVGLSLQQKGVERVEDLIEHFEDLMGRADALRKDPALGNDLDDIDDLVEELEAEERKLRNLENGVVLKGSNHPFVKAAIEYGKKAHESLCSGFSAAAKVCDEEFDGVDGRPDLVAVNGDGLWVIEFKPDNSRARALGESQLDRYAPDLEEYFREFFPNGRGKGFSGEPPSKNGGLAMLRAVDAEDDAWESDGKTLNVRRAVVTYRPCEKNF